LGRYAGGAQTWVYVLTTKGLNFNAFQG